MTPDTTADSPAPRSLFDRLGAALPVALTAVATAFAGMSTSEMTRAMLWRSAAAQDQAKATSQWTLAGFKRTRAQVAETSAATLRAAAGYTTVAVTLGPDANRSLNPQAVEWLNGAGPPPADVPPPVDVRVTDVATGVRKRVPEPELVRMAAGIPLGVMDDAINAAEAYVERTTEGEWDPVVKAAGAIVAKATADAAGKKDAERDARVERAAAIQAAGFELEGRRYRAEAGLNQQVGFLYEVRIRVLTAASDRHRVRSQNFFYAMLAAQVGATVASLALARRQRSALWLVAGLAGVVAIGMGVYVYLGM